MDDFERIPMRQEETFEAEKGASLAEYALLVLLIAIVALIAVTIAGEEVSNQYSIIASSVGNA